MLSEITISEIFTFLKFIEIKKKNFKLQLQVTFSLVMTAICINVGD